MEKNKQKTANEKASKGEKEKKEGLEERVLLVRRVSKKTPGGNYINFSALVAVGDKNGRVGIGLGRGLEVPQAIKQGFNYAKKHMISVPMRKETIPFEVRVKYKSAKILIKPAPPGTGLKVGSVVRLILGLAGIKNASGKIFGSRNQINNAYATLKALKIIEEKWRKSTDESLE